MFAVTLLGSRLTLGDVHDVEALCRRILDDTLGRLGAFLPHHDHEDALTHLIAEAWLLHQRFDTKRNDSFAGYARSVLPRRMIDYYRARFGRGGARLEPAGSWSLDAQDADPHEAVFLSDDFDPAFRAQARAFDPDELSPGSRRLWEHLLDGLSQVEIAARRGETTKTLSAKMARLRAELEHLGVATTSVTSEENQWQAA